MTVAIPAVGWLLQPCVAISAACGYTSQLVTLAIPAVGGYSSRALQFLDIPADCDVGYTSRGWLFQPCMAIPADWVAIPAVSGYTSQLLSILLNDQVAVPAMCGYTSRW
jgi:hypothetical protein